MKLISERKVFYFSITYDKNTQINEINGVDYYFIKENQFQKMINEDQFLEHAKVFNNFYGTTKKNVIDYLKKEKCYI